VSFEVTFEEVKTRECTDLGTDSGLGPISVNRIRTGPMEVLTPIWH